VLHSVSDMDYHHMFSRKSVGTNFLKSFCFPYVKEAVAVRKMCSLVEILKKKFVTVYSDYANSNLCCMHSVRMWGKMN